MPGLSKSPAAYNIDVNDDGVITLGYSRKVTPGGETGGCGVWNPSGKLHCIIISIECLE